MIRIAQVILVLSSTLCVACGGAGDDSGSGGTTGGDAPADSSAGSTGSDATAGGGAPGADASLDAGAQEADGTIADAAAGTGAQDNDAGPGSDDAAGPAVPGTGAVGEACETAADCLGPDATCMDLPGGYCAISGCSAGTCPAGSVCFSFTDGGSFCLDSCSASSECRETEGYFCDSDNTCWSNGPAPSPVGGPCETADDCADPGAICYADSLGGQPTGFIGGYCLIWECTDASCPAGSTCLEVTSDGGTACFASCAGATACPQLGYQCTAQSSTCWPGCASDAECPDGSACHPEHGFCVAGWSNEPFVCTDQTFEPNDTLSTGESITAPGAWDGLQLCDDEEDWLTVTIPEGQLGTVGLTFPHILGDLDLVAYDDKGKFLGSRLWVEDYPLDWRGNENQYEYLSIMGLDGPATAFFRVRPFAGATNTYDLEVLTTEWQDGLLCTDFYGFDACRGFNGTAKGELYQFPFASADDPYVPDGYSLESYGSYRWLRRETIMVVRYAIHETQQRFPGTDPLGLIDMCDKDGVTPGFDVGDPRHPESTHDQGGNIDIAYYQTDGDSSGGAVCGPNNSAHDGYFCTSVANHIMDVPRTTYFMAMLARHPRLRVIGVDKLLAPLIESEAAKQREAGWITQQNYSTLLNRLAYGDGWPFHHHHLHMSMRWWSDDASMPNGLVAATPEPPVGCGFRLPGDGPL